MAKSLREKARMALQRDVSKDLLYFGVIVLSVVVVVNIHEIGHTVFARFFGDNQATYSLYRLQSDGSLACIGCNAYNETALSWAGNVVVTLGGVIFSQGLALLALWYGRRRKVQRCWHFCKILVVMCAFDAVFQVLQGMFADTAHQTGLTRVDIADFIWLVAGRTGISDIVIKIGIVVVLLVYLWWFGSAYRKAGVLSASSAD